MSIIGLAGVLLIGMLAAVSNVVATMPGTGPTGTVVLAVFVWPALPVLENVRSGSDSPRPCTSRRIVAVSALGIVLVAAVPATGPGRQPRRSDPATPTAGATTEPGISLFGCSRGVAYPGPDCGSVPIE